MLLFIDHQVFDFVHHRRFFFLFLKLEASSTEPTTLG